MGWNKDLTGMHFGKLVVLSYHHSEAGKGAFWNCKCDCGNETIKSGISMSRGNTSSCGCLWHPVTNDLTGKTFGYWTVLKLGKKKFNTRTNRSVQYTCKCICGNEVDVAATSLITGTSTNCGCIRAKQATKHGHASTKYKWSSPTYSTWKGLRSRCNNPNDKAYHRYGGRGIKVCDRWNERFENFLEDMGEKPIGLSLDRVNNDGNYEPSNCRWATTKQQGRNKRTAKLLTLNGITKSQIEWEEDLNLKKGKLTWRLNNGWSLEKALTTPNTHSCYHIE